MRILFSFAGGTGHAEPMVAIAAAAQAAGHDVAFAGAARYLPRLAARGFSTLPLTKPPEAAASSGAGSGASPVSPAQPQALVAPSQDNEDRVIREHYFTQLPRSRMAALTELVANYRPDIVVREETDFTAALVAEKLGIPRAVVLVLAAGMQARPELVAEPVAALRAENGLPPDPGLDSLYRDLVLSPSPPSFRDPESPVPVDTYSFRIADASMTDAEDLPPWWSELSDAPIVYLTLGTVFPLESGDLFQRLLSGLARLPVQVVATVGPDLDPASLGPQPDNVHLERWLPQPAVLAQAALVVSHGGSGTVTGALARGLPQLVLAMGADQLHNADRVQALGIGRSLNPISCTAQDIAAAADELLHSAAVQHAASFVQREIAGLPPADTVIEMLMKLV